MTLWQEYNKASLPPRAHIPASLFSNGFLTFQLTPTLAAASKKTMNQIHLKMI